LNTKGKQTPDQMILAIMQVMEGPAAETATLTQIRECAKEMALRAEDPLRWAIEFAAQNLATFSAAAWLDVTLKLAAFRTNVFLLFGNTDGKEIMPVGGKGFFPSREEIREVHRAFNDVLSRYASDTSIEFQPASSIDFQPAKAPVFQLCRREDGNWTFNIRAADFVTDCKIKFMRLVGDFANLIRVCHRERHGCGKRFLATRLDKIYCSTVCANRAATRGRRARLGKAKKSKANKRTAKGSL
jgi:hypothetical protein